MDWVRLSDPDEQVDLSDRPRKLTSQEIKYIAEHMPLAPSADPDSAELNRNNIMEWIIETLKEVHMCPSAIPDLIDQIVEQHEKSLISAATPVGTLAAETFGAIITQMTLNTFHSSGSAKSVSFGINDMRDLIFARKTRKKESCTIYFSDKQATYEQILDSRSYIVGSVIWDFIEDYDIDSPNALQRYWWHDSAEYLLGKYIPKSTQVLRLFLNTAEMFKHKVTIAQLANILEKEDHSAVTVIYGPISDGIIDVYPDPGRIAEPMTKIINGTVPSEIAEITFFETLVLPDLKTIRVKGISGIKSLYPVVSPIWRIVLLERKISLQDIAESSHEEELGPYIGDAYSLFLNQNIMQMTGISGENLAILCSLAGIKILPSITVSQNNNDVLRLNVSMPNDRFKLSNGKTVFSLHGKYYTIISKIEVYDVYLYKEVDNDIIDEKTGERVITDIDDGWLYVLEREEKKTEEWFEDKKPKIVDKLEPDDIKQVDDTFYLKVEPATIYKFEFEEIPPHLDVRNINNDKGFDLDDIEEGETVKIDDNFYIRIPLEQEMSEKGIIFENLTDDEIRIRESKPSEYVNEKVLRDKKKRIEQIKEKTKAVFKEAETLPEDRKKSLIRKPIDIPRTPLMVASEFVTAKTEGSNLKELFSLPEVDKTRTTCNNMFTICETLGIEATRTYLINALTETIESTSSYVNPANTMIIAEFITSRGYPHGATYSGISRQPGGHLSLATLERAGKVFLQGALHGRREDIRNVSASVATGTRMAIGDGYFDIAQNITENGVERTIINDDLFEALKLDDSSKELINQRTKRKDIENVDDIDEEINAMQGNNISYDFAPEEEASSILSLNLNEIVSEVPTGPSIQTNRNQRLVTRVQSKVSSEDLIDVLSLIKTGVPIEDISKTSIPPLILGVKQQAEPIISTGLVIINDINLVESNTSNELEMLLNQYANDFKGKLMPITRELPKIEVPQLPNPGGSGDYNKRTRSELRQEQIGPKEFIDINSLQKNLNG